MEFRESSTSASKFKMKDQMCAFFLCLPSIHNQPNTVFMLQVMGLSSFFREDNPSLVGWLNQKYNRARSFLMQPAHCHFRKELYLGSDWKPWAGKLCLCRCQGDDWGMQGNMCWGLRWRQSWMRVLRLLSICPNVLPLLRHSLWQNTHCPWSQQRLLWETVPGWVLLPCTLFRKQFKNNSYWPYLLLFQQNLTQLPSVFGRRVMATKWPPFWWPLRELTLTNVLRNVKRKTTLFACPSHTVTVPTPATSPQPLDIQLKWYVMMILSSERETAGVGDASYKELVCKWDHFYNVFLTAEVSSCHAESDAAWTGPFIGYQLLNAGVKISVLHLESVEDCKTACLQLDMAHCSSIEYQPSTGECTLNTAKRWEIILMLSFNIGNYNWRLMLQRRGTFYIFWISRLLWDCKLSKGRSSRYEIKQ